MSSKALVVLSGGQDSATCLAIACQDFKEVYTISFNYGQRHIIELSCAKELSSIARVKEHFILDVPSIAQLGNSALLTMHEKKDVNGVHPSNRELPASFVPGRNYIFLGLAAAAAYKLDINEIFTGVCQTDFSGYPDCRADTIHSINMSLKLAMDFAFVIQTPLMYMTKAETVKIMERLGKLYWYGHTHTCYNGVRPPCGKCPACKLRAKGFTEAGIKDPLMTEYKGE